VQVPEGPGGTAGTRPTLGVGTAGGAGFWPADGVDLRNISDDLLGIAVPRFADGAAVFVLERHLAGGPGESAGPATGQQAIARRLGSRFAGPGGPVPGDAFPAGEVIAFAPASPYTQAAHTRQPVRFGQPDPTTLERARPGARQVLSRQAGFVVLPMTAQDGVLAGLLVVCRTGDRPLFSEAEIGLLAGIAARTGNWIIQACLLAEHQRIAQDLQLGLRPARPARQAGIELAARCLPAAGHIIGGDWYDVVPLPGDRTGLLVGDAMGHGPAAAAVMAQLRAAAHALADTDPAPAELLRRLDRTAAALTNVTYATCAYCVIDPSTGTGTIALAGHLPPVIALPDGTTRAPTLPSGLSLGLGTAIFGQVRIGLAPGAVLALFTDGLVESRSRSFDHGILELRSELTRHSGPGRPSLDAMADRLVTSLAPEREDDVTVLLAQLPGGTRPAPPRNVRL
jgi:Stage II sporulation protein E (SpoIIE)